MTQIAPKKFEIKFCVRISISILLELTNQRPAFKTELDTITIANQLVEHRSMAQLGRKTIVNRAPSSFQSIESTLSYPGRQESAGNRVLTKGHVSHGAHAPIVTDSGRLGATKQFWLIHSDRDDSFRDTSA